MSRIGKLPIAVPSGVDVATHRLCQDLVACGFGPSSRDRVSVPEPMGIVPRLNMWLQVRIAGVPAGSAITRRTSQRP